MVPFFASEFRPAAGFPNAETVFFRFSSVLIVGHSEIYIIAIRRLNGTGSEHKTKSSENYGRTDDKMAGKKTELPNAS